MLYLLLTTACAAAIMIAMRLSGGHVTARFSMLAVNYIVCALLSWGFSGFGPVLPSGEGAAVTLSLGTISGIFYIGGLALSQYNIPRNGVVLPSVASRLGGLLVPLAVAICLFAELPRPVQVMGAVIALVSIVVLNYDKDHMSAGSVLPLAALFLVDGGAAAMSKLFREWGDPAQNTRYLLMTFGTALLLCGVVILLRREKPGLQELLYGAMVGVPNFFASHFLLLALRSVPAIIVYPVRSVGGIALVALAGVVCFGERMKRHQWAALAAICVAMTLLNL